MAERRMFCKTIISSDLFIELEPATQALYFHLAMNADDDGFVNSVNGIIRLTGTTQKDLNILIEKKFIIKFNSGVCVICHWKLHNYLRSDRYKETLFLKEKELLNTDEQRVYSLGIPAVNQVDTTGIPLVYQMDTQFSIDKISIDKISIDKINKDLEDSPESPPPKKKNTRNETLKIIDSLECSENLRVTYLEFFQHRQEIKRKLTPLAFIKILNKLNNWNYDDDQKIESLNSSIAAGYPDVYEIKQQNTYKPRNNANSNILQGLYNKYDDEENRKKNIIDMEKI